MQRIVIVIPVEKTRSLTLIKDTNINLSCIKGLLCKRQNYKEENIEKTMFITFRQEEFLKQDI
jgi:hypothetical protein